ncbi:MAG: hypothetical protein ABH833_02380 [Parcubacteria group bacterium]
MNDEKAEKLIRDSLKRYREAKPSKEAMIKMLESLPEEDAVVAHPSSFSWNHAFKYAFAFGILVLLVAGFYPKSISESTLDITDDQEIQIMGSEVGLDENGDVFMSVQPLAGGRGGGSLDESVSIEAANKFMSSCPNDWIKEVSERFGFSICYPEGYIENNEEPIDIYDWKINLTEWRDFMINKQGKPIPSDCVISEGYINFSNKDAYQVIMRSDYWNCSAVRLILVSGPDYTFVISQQDREEPIETIINSISFE